MAGKNSGDGQDGAGAGEDDDLPPPSTYKGLQLKTSMVPVPIGDLGHAVIPPHPFAIERIVPTDTVTLLAGHGGAGKTFLALIIAALLAVGRTLSNLHVRRSRVLYVSLEDNGSVVRERMQKICRAWGLSFAAVEENMVIFDASNAGPMASEVSRKGGKGLEFSDVYADIKALIKHDDFRVIVIDNASEAFDGNENDRCLVRAFVRGLRMMIRDRNAAVLLLAHVNKETAKGARGESYSGSTQWHNSSRSRLYLHVDESGILRLEHEKTNYGVLMKDPLCFHFDGELGVPVLDDPASRESPAMDLSSDDDAVYEAIEEAGRRGMMVSTALAGAGAATATIRAVLTAVLSNKRIQAALIRLEFNGRIVRVMAKTAERKDREIWVVAPNAPNAPNDEISDSTHSAHDAFRRAPNAPNARGGYGGNSHTDSAADSAQDDRPSSADDDEEAESNLDSAHIAADIETTLKALIAEATAGRFVPAGLAGLIRELTHLPVPRAKAALDALEAEGRIRRDTLQDGTVVYGTPGVVHELSGNGITATPSVGLGAMSQIVATINKPRMRAPLPDATAAPAPDRLQ